MKNKSSGFSLIEILVVISIMALLAIYLADRIGELIPEDKFYKTCYLMEDIKEAIIGKPGLYCNGVQQFTGYVSDMGNLPNLYYFGAGKWQKVTRADFGVLEAESGEGGLAESILNGERPQPMALWTAVVGNHLPEWTYNENARLWSGWRGPYIDCPRKDALRDAWDNKFIFIIGEVVGYDGKTYRCKKTYVSQDNKQGRKRPYGPDTNIGKIEYWETIDEHNEMNFREWHAPGSESEDDWPNVDWSQRGVKLPNIQTKEEIFYGDSCLTIISLGKDGRPGGDGLNKDIQLVIEPDEYMGEIAGNAGDKGNFVEKLCLYVPNYTEDGGNIERLRINMEDKYTQLPGINFRFGNTPNYRYGKRWICQGGMEDACNQYAGDCDCLSYKSNTDICLTDWDCSLCNSSGGCLCYSYKRWGRWYHYCDRRMEYCGDPLHSDLCVCTENCGGSCSDICKKAACSEKPSFPNDYWGSFCSRFLTCTCSNYKPYCYRWSCPNNIGDGHYGCDCSEETISVRYDDDPNWVDRDIPIGIRGLKAGGDSYYTVSVCAGGNWIGTVKSQGN